MTASNSVAAVGARRGFVFPLNEDGVPLPAAHSPTLYAGERIGGLKTFEPTSAAPEQIVHSGDDVVLALDQLPGLEADSIRITTGKANLELDAVLTNTKVRSYGNVAKMRAGGGATNEEAPFVMAFSYQQAIDVEIGSPTFGKRRQWRGILTPSTQIIPDAQAMQRSPVDKVYNGILPPVLVLPWLEDLNETDWGTGKGNYVEIISDYQPFIAVGRGNAVLDTYALPYSPVDSANLLVWVDGTVTVPETVTTGANPTIKFATGDIPADGDLIFALLFTNEPGA